MRKEFILKNDEIPEFFRKKIRFLGVLEGGKISQARPVEPEVSLIRAGDRLDMETLVREFVPDAILPDLLRVIETRLGR